MLAALLGLLPPSVAVFIRRLRGARIERGARIGWLAFVDVDDLQMESGASISPFAVVRVRQLRMGRNARIRPLCLMATNSVDLGESVHIAPTAVVYASRSAPRARLFVGDHSRIFPFTWIEPGEGITLGKHVGIGGHGLIFTHGSWSDYLSGGPMAHGPVKLEDRVWLPWRVTVLAGVTIGSDSIVMSGSVVTKSIPAGVIAGGAPARVIRDESQKALTLAEKQSRAMEITAAFDEWQSSDAPAQRAVVRIDDASSLRDGDVLFVVSAELDDAAIERLRESGISVAHHPRQTFYGAASGAAEHFANFIEQYGIRLYRR